MPIDFSTDIGKVRLRVADIGDLPFLPDSVYTDAISEAGGNLAQAAKTCSYYILGILAVSASHKKMVQLEIWNKERFDSYRQFLLDTISNPYLMSYTAIPVLITGDDDCPNPLAQFTEDWNKLWICPENTTQMVHRLATGQYTHMGIPDE